MRCSPWYSALRLFFSHSLHDLLYRAPLLWCEVLEFPSPVMHNRQSCCLHGLLADKSVLTSFCRNDVPAVSTTLTLTLIRLPSSCTTFLTFTASSPLGVVGTKITVSCGRYQAAFFISFYFLLSYLFQRRGL